MTLYAQWTPNKHKAKFYDNDGTTDFTEVEETFDQVYVLPADPTREGYTFANWWTDPDSGEGTQITTSTVFRTDDDSTKIYAHWTENTYKVTFEKNDETGSTKVKQDKMADEEFTFTESKALTANTYTRDGYTFKGWMTSDGEKKYDDGATVSGLAGKTKTNDILKLYAVWEANKYTVTFDKNDSDNADFPAEKPDPASKEITFDQPYGALAVISRECYTFDGWYTKDKGGTKVESTTAASIFADGTGAHTLYAHWTPVTYTITLKLCLNNHEPIDLDAEDYAKFKVYPTEYTVLSELSVPGPNTGNRPGYTYHGWYVTDPTLVSSPYKITKGSHGNLTLIARYDIDQLHVNVDYNGGKVEGKTSDVIEFTVESHTKLTVPAYTEKPWLHFDGWKRTKAGEVEKDIPATEDFELVYADADAYYTAKWAKTEYSITYELNGPDVVNPEENTATYVYEETDRVLLDPSRAGYTFEGWFEDEDLTKAYPKIPAGTYDKALTVYAKWKANTYTVTFDKNSKFAADPDPATKDVIYDGTYGELAETTRTGYDFDGWWKDQTAEPAGGEVTASTVVKITGPQTLYAHWKAVNKTAKFHHNDGSDPEVTENITQTYDANYVLPASDPTRTGYTFAGWWTDPETGEQVKDTDVFTQTADQDIYAHWTANTYTVTFDKNDVLAADPDPATKDVTYDGTYGELAVTTKTGYEFAGWWKDPTAEPEDGEVTASTEVKITGPQTLYAHWKAVNKTAKFHHNDGSDPEVTENITQTYDKNYVLPASDPTRTGYTFAGWWTDPETGEQVKDTDVFKQTADQDIYAHWTANTYTVTFDKNDALAEEPVPATKDVTYDGTYGELAVTTKTGYNFAGWWKDPTAEPEDGEVTASTEVEITGPQTLYAHWAPVTTTARFHGNGGTPEVSEVTQTYDAKYVLPEDPVREGYVFKGWWTDPEAGEQVTTDTPVTAVTDQDLHAHWEIGTFTITFDSDGGSTVAPVTQEYGTKVTAPEDPVREGYTFVQWNKDGSKYEFTTMPGEDVSLKAVWKINRHTITFDSNGGSAVAPITQDYGTKVTAPEDPVREGYTFVQWNRDGVKYEFGTIPDEDVALEAEWKINQYTITFDLGNGKTVTVTQDYGTPVKAPQIPTWEHHTCHGWDVPVPATMPAGDMIISAVWTVDAFNISYDLDGGVLIDPKTQYTTYEDFVLDVPERYSYDFLGWTGSNGDVPQVRVEIKKGTIGDLSFTAHWAYRQRSFNSAAPAGLRRYNAPGSGGGIISKGNWELIDQEDHRWKFHGDDGSLAKDGWYYLENPYTQNGNDRAWFCFDKNGFLIYGWIKGEGYTWYYANEYSDSDLGMLCYGWHYDRQDGKAYYLDPITGIMRWGWQKIDGYWYFFTAPEQTSGQTWFFNIHDILGTGLTWLGAWGYGQDPTRRPFGSMWVNEQTPDGRFVDEEGHLVGDL